MNVLRKFENYLGYYNLCEEGKDALREAAKKYMQTKIYYPKL